MPPKLSADTEKRFQAALDFLATNPTEKPVTACRIFHVNSSTFRTRKYRQLTAASKPPRRGPHGGQNKILSDVQNEVIRRYVQRSYDAGCAPTRAMLWEAIVALKGAEMPPKGAPSRSWFGGWIKRQRGDFHGVRTRPMDAVLVGAREYCEEMGVRKEEIFDSDEVGFRMGIAPGKEVFVPSHVKEIYVEAPETDVEQSTKSSN